MKRSEHRDITLSYFRRAAVEKEGFYDAADGEPLKQSFWQRLVRYHLTRSIARLRPVTVVDVGCGNGDFVLELATRFPQVNWLGRDFSAEMIEVAQERRTPLPNLSYEVADLLAVEPDTPRFDLVLCLNMFHHLHPDDVARGMDSLCHLSRGTLLFELKPRECVWNRYLRPDSGFPFHLVSQKEVIRHFAKRGFTHRRTWNIFWFLWLSPISVLEFQAPQP